MNDVFVEQIIRRKSDNMAKFKKFAIIFGIVTLCVGAIFATLLYPEGLSFFPLVFFLAIYFGAMFYRLQNIEFEYSLTNGDLDIDKIAGKRKRTRVTALNIRGADIIAPMSERFANEYKSANVRKVIDASVSDKEERWFIKYSDKDGQITVLIFSPHQRMLEAIEKVSSRNFRKA